MSNRATFWLLSCAIAILFGVGWRLHALSLSVAEAVRSRLVDDRRLEATLARLALAVERLDPIPIEKDHMTTTYLSGGQPHSVFTARNPGESIDDWVDRHGKAVKADMAGAWPPD